VPRGKPIAIVDSSVRDGNAKTDIVLSQALSTTSRCPAESIAMPVGQVPAVNDTAVPETGL